MKDENNAKSVGIDGTDKVGHGQQPDEAERADTADATGVNTDNGPLCGAAGGASDAGDRDAFHESAGNTAGVGEIAFSSAESTSGGIEENMDGIDITGAAGDAVQADTAGEEKKRKKGSEAMAWIRDILIAVLIAVIIAQFIQPTIVREHSMQETLQPNDYLILSKMSYKFSDIEYGDIVVFKSNVETEDGKKKLLIKRVIAKGGDTISIADGQVYRNGELLDEPYTKDGYTNGGLDEVTVPEGELFLMGDNRVVSVDSRSPEVGFVSEDLIVGKAVVRLFPFNQIGSVYKNLPENADESGAQS